MARLDIRIGQLSLPSKMTTILSFRAKRLGNERGIPPRLAAGIEELRGVRLLTADVPATAQDSADV